MSTTGSTLTRSPSDSSSSSCSTTCLKARARELERSLFAAANSRSAYFWRSSAYFWRRETASEESLRHRLAGGSGLTLLAGASAFICSPLSPLDPSFPPLPHPSIWTAGGEAPSSPREGTSVTTSSSPSPESLLRALSCSAAAGAASLSFPPRRPSICTPPTTSAVGEGSARPGEGASSISTSSSSAGAGSSTFSSMATRISR
mmetsp:Transcript_26966/g.82766  ORF Transcript_26966/g.82766 Transcript_26966/m.82766 type:complete len:203 (+) Transcript_26966:956-1564(+)